MEGQNSILVSRLKEKTREKVSIVTLSITEKDKKGRRTEDEAFSPSLSFSLSLFFPTS